MPVPLSTCLLALAFLFAALGWGWEAAAAAVVAVVNQIIVEIALARRNEEF